MDSKNATQHAKAKTDKNTVGKIITRIGTHKTLYRKGDFGNKAVYVRVEEE